MYIFCAFQFHNMTLCRSHLMTTISDFCGTSISMKYHTNLQPFFRLSVQSWSDIFEEWFLDSFNVVCVSLIKFISSAFAVNLYYSDAPCLGTIDRVSDSLVLNSKHSGRLLEFGDKMLSWRSVSLFFTPS